MTTNNSINAPIGSVGQYLFNDGTSYKMLNPLQDVLFFDDFVCGDGKSALGWGLSTANSGTITMPATLDNGHSGIVALNTNAGTAAQACISLFNSSSVVPILLGGGRIICDFLINISALGDGTDGYSLYIGLGNVSSGEPTNGCYFYYYYSVNAGKWVLKAADNSTRTTANSNDAVAAATWTKLRIDVNADATSVAYYVNGVQCANSPITTNIPTAAGRAVSPMIQMKKGNGTNNRTCYADLCWFYQHLTTSR